MTKGSSSLCAYSVGLLIMFSACKDAPNIAPYVIDPQAGQEGETKDAEEVVTRSLVFDYEGNIGVSGMSGCGEWELALPVAGPLTASLKGVTISKWAFGGNLCDLGQGGATSRMHAQNGTCATLVPGQLECGSTSPWIPGEGSRVGEIRVDAYGVTKCSMTVSWMGGIPVQVDYLKTFVRNGYADTQCAFRWQAQ